VFNNSHGLFIVFITYFLGILPSKKEWLGVLLVIIGIILMINDPKAERTGVETGRSFLPALIDIGSACFGAFYFLMSAKNVKSIPICLLLLIMNAHTWLINSMIAKSVDPQIKLFSIDM
jgi:drug/metabolite transporter (DMT)-like permease